jgi:polar amino acid transport system substrate-binding protein
VLRLRLFLYLVLIVPGVFCRAQSPLVLNTNSVAPLSTPDYTGLYDLVLKEAFRRIGVDIAIVQLPSERALANVNSGIDDGNFARTAGLNRLYPNLIRVPEKLIDMEFVAFTRDERIRVTDWESLKPYHVGILNGWKILERNVVGTASLIKLKNQQLLFTMLAKGRVDLVVYSRRQGSEVVKARGLKDVRILTPPLAVREMFLYLNSRHQALVPGLTAALREMKRDGSYARFANQALPSVKIGVDSWDD